MMFDLPIIRQEYTWQEMLGIAKSRGMDDVVEIFTYRDPPDIPFKSDG